MKKIELDEGIVEYRLPNVAEAMILLGDMGFSMADLESMADKEGKVKDTYFLGHLLNKMDKFITKIELNSEGVEIKEYDMLLSYPEFLPSVLMVIASDVMSTMGSNAKKKKPLKKRV